MSTSFSSSSSSSKSRGDSEHLRRILRQIQLNKEALDKSIEEYAAFVTKTPLVKDNACLGLPQHAKNLDKVGRRSDPCLPVKNVHNTSSTQSKRESRVSHDLRKFLYEEAGLPDSFDDSSESSIHLSRSEDSAGSQTSLSKMPTWSDLFTRVPGSHSELTKLEKKSKLFAKEFSAKFKSAWPSSRDDSNQNDDTSSSSMFKMDESSSSFFKPRLNSLEVTNKKCTVSNRKRRSRKDADQTSTTKTVRKESASKIPGKIADLAKTFAAKVGTEFTDSTKRSKLHTSTEQRNPDSFSEKERGCAKVLDIRDGSNSLKKISLSSVLNKRNRKKNSGQKSVKSDGDISKARTVMSVVSGRQLRKRVNSKDGDIGDDDNDEVSYATEAYYSLPDDIQQSKKSVGNKNLFEKRSNRKMGSNGTKHQRLKPRAEGEANGVQGNPQGRRPRHLSISAGVTKTSNSKGNASSRELKVVSRQKSLPPEMSRQSNTADVASKSITASSVVRKKKTPPDHSPPRVRPKRAQSNNPAITLVQDKQPMKSASPKKQISEGKKEIRRRSVAT